MAIEIVTILVMTLPMILFGIYPGLKLADYLDDNYSIGEDKKRVVMIATTVIFTLTLSSLLYYL